MNPSGPIKLLSAAEVEYLEFVVNQHRGKSSDFESFLESRPDRRHELLAAHTRIGRQLFGPEPSHSGSGGDWQPSGSFMRRLAACYGETIGSEGFGAALASLDPAPPGIEDSATPLPTLTPSTAAPQGPQPGVPRAADTEPNATDLTPESVGRYVKGREVARGGMGVIHEVWDQDIGRRLAMKVMLDRESGVRDGNMLARFVREARITGQLDHPGIVPVHDIGLDDLGQLYFTMRLVKGRDLGHVFALARKQAEGWNTTRAIEVLLKVCDAVAFAHSKGVIHRDIKPSNIMVGDFGETYVMDWGLAKVIGHDDPDSAGDALAEADDPLESDGELTLEGAIIGTPAYMAPEQAMGELHRIDRRVDVYALGGLLYRLLTGMTPYVAAGARPSAAQIIDRVLEGPPPAIVDIAPHTPQPLIQLCERAMHRDLEERPTSAQDFATGLRDYLEAERKAAEVVRESRAEAEKAETVATFLSGLFEVENPSTKKLAKMTALEILERGAKRLEDEFEEAPITQAALLHTLGNIYRVLGLPREAMPLIERGLELRRSQSSGFDSELASSLDSAAATYCACDRFEQAEPLYREALELRRQQFGEDSEPYVETLNNLAAMLMSLSRLDEAEQLFCEALEISKRVFGHEHQWVGRNLNDLGLVVEKQHRYDEAEALYKESIRIRVATLGPNSTRVATTLCNLGVLYRQTGKPADAERCYRESLRIRYQELGPNHIECAFVFNNLGVLLVKMGRYGEAKEYFEKALSARIEQLGTQHENIANTYYNLAAAQRGAGDYDQAERGLKQAIELYERRFDEDHPHMWIIRRMLAYVYADQGRLDEAEELAARAYQIHVATGGADSIRALDSQHVLRVCASHRGDTARAIELQRDLLAKTEHLGDAVRTGEALANLGAVLCDAGQYEEAESFLRDALEQLAIARFSESRAARDAHERLAESLDASDAVSHRQHVSDWDAKYDVATNEPGTAAGDDD